MSKFIRFLRYRWDSLDTFEQFSIWFFFTFGGFMVFAVLSVVSIWFFVLDIGWVLGCFSPFIKSFLVRLVEDWRVFK